MTLIVDQLELVGKRAHDLTLEQVRATGAVSDQDSRRRELDSLVDVLLGLGQAMRRGVDRFWREATEDLDMADAHAAVVAELEWASQVASLLAEVERAQSVGLVVERADELRAAHEGATVMGTNILAMNRSAEEATAAGNFISLEDITAEPDVG